MRVAESQTRQVWKNKGKAATAADGAIDADVSFNFLTFYCNGKLV